MGNKILDAHWKKFVKSVAANMGSKQQCPVKRGRKVTVVETAEKMGKKVIRNQKVSCWMAGTKGVTLYPV
jgi:hypothetical protein